MYLYQFIIKKKRTCQQNMSVLESLIGRTCDFIFRPENGHTTSFESSIELRNEKIDN